MTPREIELTEFQDELRRWAGEGRLALHGRINDGDDRFTIGVARDALGTVLHLHRLDKLEWREKRDKDKQAPETSRECLQWWAKIAVRSGYRLPEIDPAAFATLVRLRSDERCRIEFIFDTNGLVGGTGHFLVRLFGDRADLVRTVVTDLEIQNLGDNLGRMNVTNLTAFDQRATYLAASRFMERVPHAHPIWRRLDTGEETALFVAQSSGSIKGGGSKNAGRDTLLLRACRRAILDQVPDLHRFFVTEDKNVARAALHELPRGSIISSYVNPLPPQDVYLTPYFWLPSPGARGRIYPSNIAAFVWEALCLCAVVELQREDGAIWRVRAYEPGANQYPSTWAAPRVYVEELGAPRPVIDAEAGITAVEVQPAATPVLVREVGPPPTSDAPQPETRRPAMGVTDIALPMSPMAERGIPRDTEGAGQEDTSGREDPTGSDDGFAGAEESSSLPDPSPQWPLKKENAHLLTPGPPARPEVPAKTILEALAEIAAAIRESRVPDLARIAGNPRPLRNLRAFLRIASFLDADEQLLPAAVELPALFEQNDLDGVSRLCTAAEPYHTLIAALRKHGTLPLEEVRAQLGSAYQLASLARLLGQAVLDGTVLFDGGRWVGAKTLCAWVQSTVDQLVASSPLHEARIADVARRALVELGLSPIRFGRALGAALARPELSALEPATGGRVEAILVERVAVLRPGGVHFEEISADGLCGIRSLKKRSP